MSEDGSAYDELLDRYARVVDVGNAQGLLRWDQQVMMPEGGTPARSKQLSTLSSLSHDLLTDERVGELLDDLEDADLDAEQAGAVREIRREYRRETRVPRELVERISEAASEALPVWESAREEDDWDAFAPALEELLDLKREYAHHIDPDRDPYAVLFEDYEPYLGLDTAERVLGRLADEVPPLIDAVRASEVDLPSPFEGEFDPATQEDLARDVLDALGYEWEHGRLDTSTHPFSTGTQFDARVTTRFSPEDPLDSLYSTVHEFGHATYTLGLPREEYGSPLGQSRDMTVHESQSRLWENHVGRSRAFWKHFLPALIERFPRLDGLTPGEMYAAANRVDPDNTIRVEADELTYHMHIALRFEIERDLVADDLDVAEVPQVWNDKMEEYLGVRPETDRDGALQDIHWSHGNFGYFPTYSLGSVLAAQLSAAAEDAIDDLDGRIAAGEFAPLTDWLCSEIHRPGARMPTDDLVESATGEAYSADHFLEYVTEKYGELYDL
ncbi:carboxypeptidase M32 [Halanaeroarchaeum sulfurireducens]|uniref:Metal-dependent carboxypeptidase n=1 Tax=Halanaeroarchaeum sulfurireducens TaxID=1604004 RepID=A0A0F7P839_9EURY|nr:carboxypeptidase M32 [Halanaeroarchaeum sulfurireducens]AKH96892.1 carboxypeptidase Taq [Halanaeroarchaeum sulfurireducens]ALG81294.1 carboxypeptidase Taq [Halanaeroarchaeum sulfurireducens]